MELYEALKNGTSVEDLEAAFRRELTKAQERVAEEAAKEEQKKEEERLLEIGGCREELAESIYNYVCALVGEDNVELDIEEIKDTIMEYEKEMVGIYNITKKVDSILNDIKKGKVPAGVELIHRTMNDEDTIKEFLKNL